MLCRYCQAEGHDVKMRAGDDRHYCPECDGEQVAPPRQVYHVRVRGTWESTYEVHAASREAAEHEACQAVIDLAGGTLDTLVIKGCRFVAPPSTQDVAS
jgi:hypothetical protein